MLRRSLLAVAAAAAAAPGARAQTGEGWPQRTITLVVPSAPGGTLDALARFFAQAMSSDLGRTVVVENASGAGGAGRAYAGFRQHGRDGGIGRGQSRSGL